MTAGGTTQPLQDAARADADAATGNRPVAAQRGLPGDAPGTEGIPFARATGPREERRPRETEIVLVRHGETDWNRAHRIQGHADIELNELGRWQAEATARALADEQFDAIYSSDLKRAHATALAIAAGRATPVTVMPAFRERYFGSMEGEFIAEIPQRHPELYARWNSTDLLMLQPDDGETRRQFYDRIAGALATVAAAHAGGKVLVALHGGVLDCAYRLGAATGLDTPRKWRAMNASINRLLHGPEGFRIGSWGEIDHLTETLDE
ncbi:histidine phosphatase family protein [Derxia gummosa]|uniref:Histidine phosphatase family protein n=1 Tax=Derxia gummosa DSM 723 TaxID=1121388 RepID=A0A8B6X8T2_9BURK|nr:histidine phosphatase family protein [Derxia gummosa]